MSSDVSVIVLYSALVLNINSMQDSIVLIGVLYASGSLVMQVAV